MLLKDSSITADGSTDGNTFGCNLDSVTAQRRHCSSHFEGGEIEIPTAPQMTLNSQQVSATAPMLSEGNNIMQMAAQRELLLAASSDSVMAHWQHFGSHFQRRISWTAMRMEINNQLASATATKVRSEHHSSAKGQWQQWHCSAVPQQQKRLMATMPQKIRGNHILLQNQASCITAADSRGAALQKLNRWHNREDFFVGATLTGSESHRMGCWQTVSDSNQLQNSINFIELC